MMTAMSEFGLSELVRTYHRELVRFATRLVGDRSIGEDVAQDAYLALVGGKIEIALLRSPRQYLFVTARRIAIRSKRRAMSEHHIMAAFDVDDIGTEISDPFALLDSRQRLKHLASALNQLSRPCRIAFFLNRIEGRKHKDIAAELGISVSMVEKHIAHALIHCHVSLADM
jgi:RNA polymerase sigma-70 factor (ECF subfamily)